MIRVILMLVIAIGSCLAQPAVTPAVGSWNCVSTDERGNHVEFTLGVQEKEGRISATVTFPDGAKMDAAEPHAEGNSLTFKLHVNDTEVVDVRLTIAGSKLEGKFSGKDSGTGSIQGSRT